MRGAWALLFVTGGLAVDPSVERGFDHFYNLEYSEALEDFRQSAAADPGNPELRNHIAQTILYRELYRVGALESELVSGSNPFIRRPKVNPSPDDQRQFDVAIASAISLGEQRLARKPDDTLALYSLGVSYGLRGNYAFLIRKAWLDALHDATTARKYHDRVTKLDPGFHDAKLIQGVHEYVVGSLPLFYRMLGFVAGFRGDKEHGIETLELVARAGVRNRDDARILLCAVYRRERRPEAAAVVLNELIPRFPRNYILRLEMVQMYSDLGKKEEGLAVIREMEALKRSGAPGYGRVSWEKISFARGTLLFWYRDFEQALVDFKSVAEKGGAVDLNLEVLAWLRIGQTHDLLGNRQEAIAAYKQAIHVAPESDRAKEAKGYLRSRYRRKDVG